MEPHQLYMIYIFVLFYRFESESKVPSVLSSLAELLTTKQQYEKLKKYANESEKASPIIEKALQNCEYNLKWAEANVPNITTFIRKYVHDDVPDSALTLSVSFITFLLTTIYFIYECCLN